MSITKKETTQKRSLGIYLTIPIDIPKVVLKTLIYKERRDSIRRTFRLIPCYCADISQVIAPSLPFASGFSREKTVIDYHKKFQILMNEGKLYCLASRN